MRQRVLWSQITQGIERHFKDLVLTLRMVGAMDKFKDRERHEQAYTP